MSLYVLDTDILSIYSGGHLILNPRIDARQPGEVAITVISVEELLTGWYRLVRRAKHPAEFARAYQRLADTARFVGRWTVLPYPEPAIERHEQLKALILNIGKMDLRIAAITLEFGGTLVTRNRRDFQRVPGLNIEDWSV